jgi:hypothetical protein
MFNFTMGGPQKGGAAYAEHVSGLLEPALMGVGPSSDANRRVCTNEK